MINFVDITKISKTHDPNRPQISNHPYKILVICYSGFLKCFIKVVRHQLYFIELYLYVKDPYEAIYQLLTNKQKETGIKHPKDSKAFIEDSSNLKHVDPIIDAINSNEKFQKLVIFDDIIIDMHSDRMLKPVATEPFFRDWKLNTSIIVMKQSYFTVPKNVILNVTHCYIKKIPNKI